MKYSKELFGSKLIISINGDNIDENIIEDCFSKVEDFEKKYSRFIKGNYLYNLNKTKSSQITGELLDIIKLSTRVSELTNGYFDITVLPLLENLGYGIEKDKQREKIGYKNIKIDGNNIVLENDISIDIGAVGKGYIIDKIYKILDPLYNNFIINFGGDLKVKGKEKIYLEDPFDNKKIIGQIYLENLSLASSSGIKRKTLKGHHLLNPKNKKAQNDKIVIFLTHSLSSFSDIFSTALFVTPIKESIILLNKVDGLEGMIISKKGEIFKSKGFDCNLIGV